MGVPEDCELPHGASPPALERCAISALSGQVCLDAHRLRCADQVALRAEVDRICMLCR